MADEDKEYDLEDIDIQYPNYRTLFWKDELVPTFKSRQQPNFNSCCKKDDVTLPPFRETPPFLRHFLISNDTVCKRFRTNIRQYNTAFAYTSTVHKADPRLNPNPANTSFQIQGELHHYQGPLQPREGNQPRYAQLFLYNPQFATAIRGLQNNNLYPNLLRRLDTMMREYNH